MADDTVLRVRGLSKHYPIYDKPADRLKQIFAGQRKKYYRDFPALQDISFEMVRGEAVGIIGRNGSGKSTLLQLIAGTLARTAGNLEVKGRVAALLELGSGFNPEFSGRENVFLNGAILGLSREEMNARYPEIVRFADIGDFIEQPVKTYSSGMTVRLAFAVSVCVNPDILIVDEALSVGDTAFQMKCFDHLRSLRKRGLTLLFVSHDISTIRTFCDRAIYLEAGRMKSSGRPSDVVERYLLDTRDEQRRTLGRYSNVVEKNDGAMSDGVSFGTDQGQITFARFPKTNTREAQFTDQESIDVVIETEYAPDLRHPWITLLITDRQMNVLAGKQFRLDAAPAGVADRSRSVRRFRLAPQFNEGEYFITARLDDGIAKSQLFPIDKRVGVLRFSVIALREEDYFGALKIEMECVEVDTNVSPTDMPDSHS